jgi:hypothetical protein
MKRYRLFGENTELTPVAKLIMQQDLDALEECLDTDWRLNSPFEVCQYISELPITLALVENRLAVVDYLLAKKVDLNQQVAPAVVTAARNCDADTIRKLVRAGARIDLQDRVGKNALSAALYAERVDLLPLLLELGLRLDADGGKTFRQAVSGRQMKAVEFFIENWFDPNLRTPDMVFPYNPTAVGVAADNNDFKMVKYLVAHGADVTLADDYGARPFLDAVRHSNAEMADFLRALEPPEWHDPDSRVCFLVQYGVPPELISFLGQPEREIRLNNEQIRYIRFHDHENVRDVKWKRRDFLELTAVVDNYNQAGFLVWLKKERKLASVDYEHERIVKLCGWNEFMAAPDRWIKKVLP